jgi:hypothetical protein
MLLELTFSIHSLCRFRYRLLPRLVADFPMSYLPPILSYPLTL